MLSIGPMHLLSMLTRNFAELVSPPGDLMRIKQLKHAAPLGFRKVIRLDGSNSDDEMSHFLEVMTLIKIHLLFSAKSCKYTVWILCQIGFKIRYPLLGSICVTYGCMIRAIRSKMATI